MYKVHSEAFESSPRQGNPRQHPDAHYAEVTDSGHLVLLVHGDNPRQVVAVYAPGSWAYAEYVKQ
jgi:hypothetical protein